MFSPIAWVIFIGQNRVLLYKRNVSTWMGISDSRLCRVGHDRRRQGRWGRRRSASQVCWAQLGEEHSNEKECTTTTTTPDKLPKN